MDTFLSDSVKSALDFFDYSTALWLAEQQLAFASAKSPALQKAARQQLARVFIQMMKYQQALEVLVVCNDAMSHYLKALC
jgi:predicted negative regulator of RcsB-dependent stress response